MLYKVLDGPLSVNNQVEVGKYKFCVTKSSSINTFFLESLGSYNNYFLLEKYISKSSNVYIKWMKKVIKDRFGPLYKTESGFNGHRPDQCTLEELSVIVDELLYIIISKKKWNTL